jgi:hypothetical protein
MKQSTVIAGLWLALDFTPEMQAGIVEPSWINHDEIDWQRFEKAFQSAFKYSGHGVTVRFADDTVDQTVQFHRNAGNLPGPIDCKDFGQALLAKAQRSDAQVIPIREEWSKWQFLKDRTHAPPPSLIAFAMEGDVEDIVIAFRLMQGLLGVQAATDVFRTLETPANELPEDYYQGYLFPEIKEAIEETFQAPYQKFCLLTFLTDPQFDW